MFERRRAMRELAIAILGAEDSTYNNASDLLDDYFPDDTIVYLPSYISAEQTGLRVTFDWLKDAGIEYERVRKSQLFQKLLDTTAARHEVIILGVEGNEEIITHSFNQSFPVLDLTRGLYSVTASEMAPDGSGTDGDERTDDLAVPVRTGKDLGLDLLTEAQGGYPLNMDMNDVIRDIVKRVAKLEEQMSSERAHVAVGEQGWEPVVSEGNSDVAEVKHSVEEYNKTDDRTKYYKSARGKLRKAGKSKARPGETEVWLSDEEANE